MGGYGQIIFEATTWVLPVLLAVTLHEAAHGWVAWRLGDDTAYRLGRVTFNPLAHVDRFGTIILPALLLLLRAPFLFGWAKPVPVAFHRLNHPRRDMVLVAAAGPGTNIGLAVISALLFHLVWYLPESPRTWVALNLGHSVLINLVLAIFNMLPIPPLDGGRVVVGILPRELARPFARLERYGMMIIIGFLLILPMLGNLVGVDLRFFAYVIWVPLTWVLPLFNSLAGYNLASVL
jgi:Zn-dependent protease